MKTVILDMYGVIIEESKGKFIPYTFSHFPEPEHQRLTRLFREEKLFTRAGSGEMDSDAFLARLGFANPAYHMRNYIENHLTLDAGFLPFVRKFGGKYRFALLSNDVSAWSRHITAYHGLDGFFAEKIVSGDVQCRKPDARIYELALERLEVPAEDCIFVDNSVQNLRTAAGLGMDTVLFNRDGEDYEGKVVYTFEELACLL